MKIIESYLEEGSDKASGRFGIQTVKTQNTGAFSFVSTNLVFYFELPKRKATAEYLIDDDYVDKVSDLKLRKKYKIVLQTDKRVIPFDKAVKANKGKIQIGKYTASKNPKINIFTFTSTILSGTWQIKNNELQRVK